MKKITKEDIVKIIGPYCEKEENIIFGFLFGSYASGNACNESDIDIALYLMREDDKLEYKIQSDLEQLLGREVELVILNRAPSILSWDVIRKGAELTIKNRKVFLDFMLDVSNEAEEFTDFNLDAWRRKHALRAN